MINFDEFKLTKLTVIDGCQVPLGYINATNLCEKYEKQWKTYRMYRHHRDYYSLLLKLMPQGTQLIMTNHNGDYDYRGTWVHPAIAFHLALWLCPEFAVSVLCPDFLQPVGS